ncbi:LOW QUALITY PROTEIN: hypothetical protein V1478_009613 [Vespula squamosa]|uniref:Uncharacterized protein n=1 Tax=Vespula squamosa TaxID=30214 RepID=A0ABD2ASY0_VESSQ
MIASFLKTRMLFLLALINVHYISIILSIKDKIIFSLKMYEIVYMHSHYLNIDEGIQHDRHGLFSFSSFLSFFYIFTIFLLLIINMSPIYMREHLLQYLKGVLRISSYHCINTSIYYFNLKFEDLNNFLKINSIN